MLKARKENKGITHPLSPTWCELKRLGVELVLHQSGIAHRCGRDTLMEIRREDNVHDKTESNDREEQGCSVKYRQALAQLPQTRIVLQFEVRRRRRKRGSDPRECRGKMANSSNLELKLGME